MYQNSEMETVCEGWLKKSQAEKKLFRAKTGTQKSNQRWFVLKQSGELPGQYILDYYTDSTCKKQKGRVDLDQCRRIDRKIDAIKPDDYLFSIETNKRTYNLLAASKVELNKWIQCLCTVCGFKPIQPDAQLLLSLDHHPKNSKQTDLIVISYSNPYLLIENSSSANSSPIGKSLTSNQSGNQMSGQPTNGQTKEKSAPEANSRRWMNCSSTLNRTVNKLTNSTNCTLFSSATLPNRKADISGYIAISECHTGSKLIFENSSANDKSTKNGRTTVSGEKFNEDGCSIKAQSDSNKENKYTDFSKNNKTLLDSSLNSNHDLLLDTGSFRSPNFSNDDGDANYDVPRQIHKKSRIKDMLNIVTASPKEESLYANTKSLPRNSTKNMNCSLNYRNLNNNFDNHGTVSRPASVRSSSNIQENNYLNVSQNLERQRSFNEREYYNNLGDLNMPPPRPPKPRSIELGRCSRDKSTSLGSLNEQNDLNEFDPLNCVPKPPSILATSPDLMYSIPKSQIELELEKQLKSRRTRTTTNSLDMVVPITHDKFISNERDELHRYTNAAGDILGKSIDGHPTIIYEYEKPSLPVNNNLNNLNDNLDKFKIPSIKLNDKIEPMTPSLIVTSTPLFGDGQPERHFNFSDQNDPFNKPQVNRDLKPKKSDTSIESLLMYTNKSPNSRQHSDTLINRTNLSASFNCKPSSSNLNPPRVPSRGRQFGGKIAVSLEGEQFVEDIIKAKKMNRQTKKDADSNEIQYLDLDLDCDNVSLNSTMNETSMNLNFREADKEPVNASSLNSNLPPANLNSSFNANPSNTLNYSHFAFPNRNDTTNQFNSLNSSFSNNTSTVYKTVDFIKTKAFNELKDNLNR